MNNWWWLWFGWLRRSCVVLLVFLMCGMIRIVVRRKYFFSWSFRCVFMVLFCKILFCKFVVCFLVLKFFVCSVGEMKWGCMFVCLKKNGKFNWIFLIIELKCWKGILFCCWRWWKLKRWWVLLWFNDVMVVVLFWLLLIWIL